MTESSNPVAPSPRKSLQLARHAPLWLLGLFTFCGPVGMHIFTPALPDAARDLHGSAGALQLTVSFYILGLALGQLVYGPFSDRFGRRPTLLAGLSIFTAASVATALAPNVDLLIAARFCQAFGGCSGLVLARAIVRDTSPTLEAARRLALMNLIVTAGPGLAPLIGGAISGLWGWRAVLVGLCALGAANTLLAWRLLPETRPALAGLSGSAVAKPYALLLASPAFLAYAVGGGCATTSIYAFIASAPFIFIDQLGLPAAQTGLYLAILVSGVWLGSVLASRLVSRFSLTRFLVAVNAVSAAGALGFLGFVLAGRLNLIEVIGPMFVFSIGVGAAGPAALVEAISINHRITGSASGLYGFIQMAVGGTLTALVGLGSNPAVASGIVLTIACILAQASFAFAGRHRSAEPS